MEDKSKKNSKVEIIEFNETIDNKEMKPKLSKEESEQIKKKLTKLLAVLIVLGTLFITFLFTTHSNKSNSTSNNNKNDKNIVDNNSINNENIQSNKVLPEGELSISDSAIEKYKNILTFKMYDTILYSSIKDIFLTNDFSKLDNDNKIYLATKSESFNRYLESVGILNHEYGCNKSGMLEFDGNTMKKALEEVFGFDVNYQDSNFRLPYYINDTLINVYDVTFSNGKYSMNCINNYKNDLEYVIQTKINKITNNNGKLVFEMKSVFINKTGVYSDPKFTKLITNDSKITYDNYIDKGNSYKFVFEKNNDNYYLKGIEK